MKNSYDIVIIGAGIGGLVCGCYLAKNGIKVLIVEQHSKPGGYCTAFKRGAYPFNVAVHYLRGVKSRNQLGTMLNDLDLHKEIKFSRIDPSDSVIFGESRIDIYNDIRHSIDAFKKVFPTQIKNIEKFFSFLLESDFLSLYKLTRKKTFYQLLAKYFSNEQIKIPFNILLGNLGLDARDVSALSACLLYKELFSDSGYYPVGGIQAFPDALVNKYISYGGDIVFDKKAIKIKIKKNIPQFVSFLDSSQVECTKVISNIDAIQTFFGLIGAKCLPQKFVKHLLSLLPSPSAFVVHLGVSKPIKREQGFSTIWYFPRKESMNAYKECMLNKTSLVGKYFACDLSANYKEGERGRGGGRVSLSLACLAPYLNSKYWEKNKMHYATELISTAETLFGPFAHHIDVMEIAIPQTFFNFTANYNGAAYGWASVPSQISGHIMPQKTMIKNLYMCGHWTTRGWGQGGMAMVINSGKTTAEIILRDFGGASRHFHFPSNS